MSLCKLSKRKYLQILSIEQILWCWSLDFPQYILLRALELEIKNFGLVGGYREKKNPYETSCWELTHILKIFAKKKALETTLLLLINFAFLFYAERD
jgi:hypothetical protein